MAAMRAVFRRDLLARFVEAHPTDAAATRETVVVPVGVTAADAAGIPRAMMFAAARAAAASPALNKDGSFPGGRARRIARTVSKWKAAGQLPHIPDRVAAERAARRGEPASRSCARGDATFTGW
jgi:hypothetical protein